jgi:hypothetical protein
MIVKKTFRIEDSLAKDITRFAADNNMTENAAVETALKFYRDYMYMKEKSTLINDEILKVNKAGLDLLEQRINHKTNQVLSELSIQVCIIEQIIAGSLEIDPLLLPEYRRKAMEFIRTNNRVFRLDEVVD